MTQLHKIAVGFLLLSLILFASRNGTSEALIAVAAFALLGFVVWVERARSDEVSDLKRRFDDVENRVNSISLSRLR